MKKLVMLCGLTLTILLPGRVLAGSASDYLIMQDMGLYKFMGKGGGGQGSGILSPTDHFSKDHIDESYGGAYIDRIAKIGVNVEVTKHSGSDSDKWLLHELEEGFQKRDSLGSAYAGKNPIRDFIGNRIFYMWREYRWISNNIVVIIEASDPQGLKPEPTEVVQAYLQKFPSTIPSSLVLDDAHKVQWIKDEMDRRLWLCDKWFMQLQLRKAEEKDVYRESVKSMNIFLDYREKYYGMKAADEKNILAGYLNTNNGTGIKTKLKEYKDWWAVNKEKAISL
jgi:hypothetical protein